MDTEIRTASAPPQPVPQDGAGPFATYEARVASGKLDRDPEQEKAARRLDRLWRELRDYHPMVMQRQATARHGLFGGLRARLGLGGRGAQAAPSRPRGVYMVGQVGRGKTMLMDLFFDLAPVEHKRRVHFHRFMQDVHQRIHDMKVADPALSDPIPPLARQIAQEAWLLCFDEFQVNDIADAMILGRLFDFLFADGVVVVATSNTKPEDLFQDRPGADAFKPFIDIIMREVDTVILDSPRDYRRGCVRGMRTWIVPADAAAKAELDTIFTHLAAGAPVQAVDLDIMGRTLRVERAAGPVARFTFSELCGRFLGAGDYLALATRFASLVIDDVPRMGPDNFDEARRFIVLIDALYEQNVKLFASAGDQPDSLYERGQGATAFERTASRLEEMQSASYAQLPHLSA
ncbi:AFG1 family ATPase [Novacetimonas hansenii]|uniref:Cell division protein ZapE n=1 Tax=Novacetimonas hansenii TaxID=436 RepID=A0AAW5ES35_NOVHA|nr:cell division protein ZapE [Novacetimonas hansenii]MBL7238434.1 AFG1 family ATPase [Novacetimonas hansenii]MCJ8353961.1 cell division protein ZapE [Novacetimonas hansenii]PYD73870.1 cell division protein ZapE [Novacetimonas hansenii]QOF95194.1 AFG1 family ATPase [Novacetimonas hansenii]